MSTESNIVVQAIVSELAELPDEKIVEVLDFVRFLRMNYRISAKRHAPRTVNEELWTQLYNQNEDEEVQLAESGIQEYAEGLRHEDADAKR